MNEGLVDQVVLTCPEPFQCPQALVIPPPADRPDAVEAFLDHWRPDMGLWAEGHLRPVLLHGVAARGLPMLLVDGTAPHLPAGRWWMRLLPRMLLPFRQVHVRTPEAQRAYLRAGLRPDLVKVTGAMEGPSHLLPGNEAERAALSKLFGSRPIWLAVGVPQVEDAAVLQAHLSALRMTHRLLLIFVPEMPLRGQAVMHLAQDYGLQAALRSEDHEPDEDVQVYIADTEGELGLWYRLSPIAWIGGTLEGGGPARHPFEAAALGSAILHGLRRGPEAEAFELLRSHGGSRIVPTPDELGEAVADLLAADRCARLAQKAWEVSSSGVEATEQVIALCSDILDEVDP